MPDYTDDLSFALSLADQADHISMLRYRSGDLVVETKPDLSPVSDADKTVEIALRARIAAERPGDGVLAEEFGGDRQSGREWIIDPIDGTANYVRGVPIWATLISLSVDGLPVLGVVSAPALDRRWWAAQGSGATAREFGRERRLRVSNVARLEDAFVCVNSLVYWREAGRLANAVELASAAWRDRGFGDFLGYMLVAEGAIDLSSEPGVQSYDLAALWSIVTEAGGRFTGIDGTGSIWEGTALASNGRLHDAAAGILGR